MNTLLWPLIWLFAGFTWTLFGIYWGRRLERKAMKRRIADWHLNIYWSKDYSPPLGEAGRFLELNKILNYALGEGDE